MPMIVIPVESKDNKDDRLIIVLDALNVERMKAADPVELFLNRLMEVNSMAKLINPQILLCYEEMTPAFKALLDSHDLPAIVEFLHRGWKHMPEHGDDDPVRKL